MNEPVLPLRDIVVFPQMIVPLFVGRNKSVKALEIAMSDNKDIVLVTQKVAKVEDPKPKDLYSIGTICKILQLLKLPDGTLKVLVEGKKRVKIDFLQETKKINYLTCNFKILPNLGSSKVNITKINIINKRNRTKFTRGRKVKVKGYKKAIITLKKGQSIDLTTGI